MSTFQLDYEPSVSDALLKLVQPGDTVFDIGANCGILTFLCAALVGIEGKVIAFEPNTELHPEIMRQNRDLAQVTLESYALDDTVRPLATFHVDRRKGMNAVASSLDRLEDLTEEQIVRIEVSTITIDAYCTQKQLHPAVIKIDAEGVEARILSGALQILASDAPAIILEIWPSRYNTLEEFLFGALDRAYSAYILETGMRLIAGNLSLLSSGASRNLLLCPPRMSSRFELLTVFRPELPFESAIRAADLAFKDQNYSRSLIWYQLAAKCGSLPVDAIYRYAFSLHNGAHEYRRALELYATALKHGHEPFWTYYNSAQAHQALGEIKLARRAIQRAATLDPSHPGVAIVAEQLSKS